MTIINLGNGGVFQLKIFSQPTIQESEGRNSKQKPGKKIDTGVIEKSCLLACLIIFCSACILRAPTVKG